MIFSEYSTIIDGLNQLHRINAPCFKYFWKYFIYKILSSETNSLLDNQFQKENCTFEEFHKSYPCSGIEQINFDNLIGIFPDNSLGNLEFLLALVDKQNIERLGDSFQTYYFNDSFLDHQGINDTSKLSCQYEIITPANTVSCSDGLQIDHIWPKSKNGHGGPANLAVLCNTHNTEKTSNVSQVNGDLLDKKDFYEPYIHICKEIYRKI